MVAIEIILTIVMFILALAVIAVISMQETEQAGAGSLYGGDDGIFGSGAKNPKEEQLIKYTRIGAIALVVLSIVMVIIQKF